MKEQNQQNTFTENYLLPLSIFVTGVLISGSLFYNVKLLIKHIGPSQANSVSEQKNSEESKTDPNKPVSVPVREDAAVLGKQDAKVTIYEFSDFQCPFCQKFVNETFGQIKSKYIDTGKVKVIFRHYPLPSHQKALISAEAAECANRQGKFWQYHDLLFKNGKADGTGLAVEDLKKYASQLGLNQNKFNQCLDEGETALVVKRDLDQGSDSGAEGTPTLFINGNKIYGAHPFSVFEKAIEDALKQ